MLAACSPTTAPAKEAEAAPPPPPALISEADAIAFVDKVPSSLAAGDVAGAIGNYASDAILVDAGMNDLITDAATNQKATESFIKDMGPKKFDVHQEKIQVLDADNFVATILATGEMKDKSKMSFRVTQVVHKQADGSWKVVNEHFSAMPQPVKTPLPVIKTLPAS